MEFDGQIASSLSYQLCAKFLFLSGNHFDLTIFNPMHFHLSMLRIHIYRIFLLLLFGLAFSGDNKSLDCGSQKYFFFFFIYICISCFCLFPPPPTYECKGSCLFICSPFFFFITSSAFSDIFIAFRRYRLNTRSPFFVVMQ